MPGSIGGAEWGGAPFDPDTKIMYVPSITGTFAADLVAGDPKRTNLRYTRGTRELIDGPQGLPLTKPPYGRITAINMNTGDHLWFVPNGEGPHSHPALKGLKLPELGQPSRDMPLLTKTVLFNMQGDSLMVRTPAMGVPLANKLRAYDKANGKVLWEMGFPAGATGAPMTYLHGGKQFIVIPIGSRSHPGEWVALSLP
jgi:quinoprotein glucose dehydrogenase